MDSLFPLFIVIGVALVIVIAIAAHLQQQKRRQAMEKLAAQLGWRFNPSRDRSHQHEYSQFAIFRRGHSQCAYNTLGGSINIHGQTCPAKMGDYLYKVTTQSGKSSSTTTYRFSYLIVHLPYVGLPNLLIRREGMFDRLRSLVGFADINFESADFSRKFYVTSDDKRFAYDVIHPPVMEFLMSSDAPTIDIEKGHCCLANDRQVWSPEEFRAKLEWMHRFFDLWPSHLTASLTSLRH